MINRDIFEDVMSKLTYCHYISDLRPMVELKNTFEMKKVIEQISIDDYSVKQWNEFYNYLFMSKEVFETAKEARQKLLEELGR
ncbi:hypothetical protein [Candidatus Stoquefichus massiliensis]|uniref:hypothetical protein n=1 Tax=Candidatus Stoquefichus massiliensis TaxID=1470350 RepID=UPI0004845DD4|nr:hypothetical protein [Candidatus Stoquefichus massiliensis]